MDENQMLIKQSEAPKISANDIENLLARVVYKTDHPEGTTSTFVHAYLDEKFYLGSGHSACVSFANFNKQVGEDIALPKAVSAAREKLWEMEGYRLYQSLLEAPAVSPEPKQRAGLQLGDQVHYFETVEGAHSVTMIGTISAVHSPNTVSLSVLAPNGTSHARDRVTVVNPGEQPPAGMTYFARPKN